MENLSKEILEKWHQDTNNWKYGIFYFNPDDKRIFPPKRFENFGFTINFANKISVLVFSIILIVIIGFVIFFGIK